MRGDILPQRLRTAAAGQTACTEKGKKILYTNLPAIIAQAACLSAAMQPISLTQTPATRILGRSIKLIPPATASLWMAYNLRYAKNTVQYRKNAQAELLRCLTQRTAVLFGSAGSIETSPCCSCESAYGEIFRINPKRWNSPLTTKWGQAVLKEWTVTAARRQNSMFLLCFCVGCAIFNKTAPSDPSR
ncbi:hypothetical protein LI036_08535 [bacterium 210917-DFI.7.65]|nr:hypothetical protein [bacterium 210917-DFI.7.65]